MKKITILASLLFLGNAAFAQVGVGTQTPKATFDVINDAYAPAGLIAPRVTVAQIKSASGTTAYTAAQKGAIVYVTDATGATGATAKITEVGYYYFDGSAWQPFSAGTAVGGASPWFDTLTNTSATSNTANIYQLGNIGIGTKAPTHKLDVAGTLNVTGTSSLADVTSRTLQTTGTASIGGMFFLKTLANKGNTAGYSMLISDANGLVSKAAIPSGGGGTPAQYLISLDGTTGPSLKYTDNGGTKTVDLTAAVKSAESKTSLTYTQSNNTLVYHGENVTNTIGLPVTSLLLNGSNLVYKNEEGISNSIALPSGGTSSPWFAVSTNASATNNTENIYQLGKIGIGTKTPQAQLDVKGDALVNGVTIGKGKTFFTDGLAVGTGALANNVADGNTAVGTKALAGVNNTGGAYSTAVGAHALEGNFKAQSQTALGYAALRNFRSTSASDVGNLAIGTNALNSLTTGDRNVAIGYQAMKNMASGSSNIVIGVDAAQNLSGNNNIVIGNGSYAAPNLKGNNNLIFGKLNPTTLDNSILFGTGAGDERARFDNYGNFGIAIATPTAKLDVNGTTRLRSLPAGNDTQVVTTDANGNLHKMPMPSGNGAQTLTSLTSTLASGVATYNALLYKDENKASNTIALPLTSLALSGSNLTFKNENGTANTVALPTATSWYKNGTTTPSSNNNDDIYQNGSVGINKNLAVTGNTLLQGSLIVVGAPRFTGLPAVPGGQDPLVVSVDANGNLHKTPMPSTGTSGWGLNGTSASATNFLGTTNVAALTFKTNNVRRMVIGASGNVAIDNALNTGSLTVMNLANQGNSYNGYSMVVADANGNIQKANIPASGGTPSKYMVSLDGTTGSSLKYTDNGGAKTIDLTNAVKSAETKTSLSSTLASGVATYNALKYNGENASSTIQLPVTSMSLAGNSLSYLDETGKKTTVSLPTGGGSSSSWYKMGTYSPSSNNADDIYQTGSITTKSNVTAYGNLAVSGSTKLAATTTTNLTVNGTAIVNGTAKITNLPAGSDTQVVTADANGNLHKMAMPSGGGASSSWYKMGTYTPSSNNADDIYQTGSITTKSNVTAYGNVTANGSLTVGGNAKLAATTATSLTVNGNTKLSLASGSDSQVVTTDANGNLHKSPMPSGGASSSWYKQGTTTPSSNNNDAIYQNGSVTVNGNTVLGSNTGNSVLVNGSARITNLPSANDSQVVTADANGYLHKMPMPTGGGGIPKATIVGKGLRNAFTYTVQPSDFMIFNASGDAGGTMLMTVNLPAAGSCPGRMIWLMGGNEPSNGPLIFSAGGRVYNWSRHLVTGIHDRSVVVSNGTDWMEVPFD